MQNDLDPKTEARVEVITNALLHLPIRGKELQFAARQIDMALMQAGYLSATIPAGDGELVERLLMTAVDMERKFLHRIDHSGEDWRLVNPNGEAAAALLREAASRLSQGTWVTVKALEWKPAFWNQSDPDYEHIVEIWEAFGAGNIQGWVEHQKDGKFYTEGEQFDTLDAAKAAVQAKYDRIIRSALSGDTL